MMMSKPMVMKIRYQLGDKKEVERSEELFKQVNDLDLTTRPPTIVEAMARMMKMRVKISSKILSHCQALLFQCLEDSQLCADHVE